jgi:malonate-semialdehyde dehydrogenase (acetylating)/methylmalonate-semialdehyde dehydrogenase
VRLLQNLFHLIVSEQDALAKIITLECGKTFQESLGELKRAIENIEVACGAPTFSQGTFSEDIAPGIDEIMIRQPVGISLIICPFNFPSMIAFWFMPYALACGNPVIVKPSEKVPLTMQAIFHLIEKAGFPKGIIQMVQGGAETVDQFLTHPMIKTVSFVGSTAVAKKVYAQATAHGKRAQCQGGAKNPIIIMPDADPDMTIRILADSAFGCAGQRCLAASLALPVGEAIDWLQPAICKAAEERVVGFGLDEGVQMGPVISPASLKRILTLLAEGETAGARLLVDGRNAVIPGYEKGNFIKPCVIDHLQPDGKLVQTEIFGPVLGILPMDTIDSAIDWINQSAYGNMASIFTASGSNARHFRHEAMAGNIGVNIGVAAPMAFFPFSGWKDSFFGDLHGQSEDAFNFFTQKKVVIERWKEKWSRQF